MTLTRRSVLAGIASAAAGISVSSTAAAQSAAREFAVLRNGTDIGRHVISLSRDGDTVRLGVEVELVIRILGIAAYRYTMTNREVWRDGLLIEGDSDVNDDGRRKRVLSRREGDALIVESPDFTGQAPGNIATTTYFTPDFLSRAPWMSTDSGDLFAVQTQEIGPSQVDTANGPVACTRWRVRDGDVFDIVLDYDDRGEWMSVGFDAGGEPAVYRPLSTGTALGPVWRSA